MSEEGYVNSDGSFGEDMSSAPDNVKDLVTKKNFTGIGDIADAYAELEGFKGVPADRLVTLPESKDDVEGWDKVHGKLGFVYPKNAADYKVDGIKVPENTKIDEALSKSFNEFAVKNRIPQELYTALMQWQLNTSSTMLDEQDKALKETEAKADAEIKAERDKIWDGLKTTHNIKNDKEMDTLVNDSRKIAQEVGMYDTIEKKGLSDDPEIIGAFINLKKTLSEDVLAKSGGGGRDTTDNQTRVNEIINDPAYVNKMDVKHDALIQEMQDLMKTKFSRQS